MKTLSKKNNLEVIKIIPQIEEKNERNPISKPNIYLETKDPRLVIQTREGSSPNIYRESNNQNRQKTPTSNPYSGYTQKK